MTELHTVKNVYEAMDITAPFCNIDKGDNSGLLVGSADSKVTRVLIALDITVDTVEEAKAKGAELIVSHHPVIYYPLYSVSDKNPACLALKYGIACICSHSPLDMADGGINDILYDMFKEPFGLSEKREVLEAVHSDGRGYGMVCDMGREFTPAELAKKAKEILGCTAVRYTNGRNIKRLAFCSGGGGKNIEPAVKMGADALITGDVKHDQLITAKNLGVTIIDCGHYHTETVAVPYLKKRFKEILPDIDFVIAKSNVDPACYVI
jgi:dinuclear metal center YbgI/SA1388 family protein